MSEDVWGPLLTVLVWVGIPLFFIIRKIINSKKPISYKNKLSIGTRRKLNAIIDGALDNLSREAPSYKNDDLNHITITSDCIRFSYDTPFGPICCSHYNDFKISAKNAQRKVGALAELLLERLGLCGFEFADVSSTGSYDHGNDKAVSTYKQNPLTKEYYTETVIKKDISYSTHVEFVIRKKPTTTNAAAARKKIRV